MPRLTTYIEAYGDLKLIIWKKFMKLHTQKLSKKRRLNFN